MGRLLAFLEERTGLPGLLRSAIDLELGRSARLPHTLLTALLTVFVVQAFTGALLMFTYTPSADGAWSSVHYLQHAVTAGWFLRGLHSYGGQAMLLIALVHALALLVQRAYQRPREVEWWLALAVLALVAGALISGLRLPWDQQAYWALKVELNILGATPVVGPMLHDLIAGGGQFGQSTISRLFASHVALLAPLLGAVIFAARRLLRRHDAAVDRERIHYFPAQLAIDLAFVLFVLLMVALVTTLLHGAPLDAPADDGRDFPARPEWFLLFLYGLRTAFPPALEAMATMVIPGLAAAFLFALPFLDRETRPSLARRLAWLSPVAAGVFAMIIVTAVTARSDAANPDFQEARLKADHHALRSQMLARAGVPPLGPGEMLRQDPLTHGRDMYARLCTGCHVLEGDGDRQAPDHQGFGSREWIEGMVRDPDAPHYFGRVDNEVEMPAMTRKLGGDDGVRAVSEFLYAQAQESLDEPADEALVEAGRELFYGNCMRCHVFHGDGDFMEEGGPNLSLYASRTWIKRQILDPHADTQYREIATMPAFLDQLTEHDARMISAFLRRQRYEMPEPPSEQELAADDED